MHAYSVVSVSLISLTLSGCLGNDLSCSSSDVKDAVVDLFRSKILGNPVIAERIGYNMFVYSKNSGSVTLDAIRTQEKSDRRVSCIGNITSQIPVIEALNEERKKNDLPPLGEESAYKSTREVIYTSELTDDGQIYVSIQDLR